MTLLQASEYVQRHARIAPLPGGSGESVYSVRYPATATRAFFHADTWELVRKVYKKANAIALAKIKRQHARKYGTGKKKRQSATSTKK